MCLSKVIKDDFDPGAEITAWKLVEKLNNNSFCTPYFGYLIVENKWLEAKDTLLRTEKELYTSGFHAFLSRDDAKLCFLYQPESHLTTMMCILKVRMRKIIAVGVETPIFDNSNSTPVVVAKEIFISLIA